MSSNHDGVARCVAGITAIACICLAFACSQLDRAASAVEPATPPPAATVAAR